MVMSLCRTLVISIGVEQNVRGDVMCATREQDLENE